jgi:hypothetical protein
MINQETLSPLYWSQVEDITDDEWNSLVKNRPRAMEAIKDIPGKHLEMRRKNSGEYFAQMREEWRKDLIEAQRQVEILREGIDIDVRALNMKEKEAIGRCEWYGKWTRSAHSKFLQQAEKLKAGCGLPKIRSQKAWELIREARKTRYLFAEDERQLEGEAEARLLWEKTAPTVRYYEQLAS